MRALIVLQLMLAAGPLTASAQQNENSDVADRGEIAVKQTVPAEVVYLVHVGPYWTVGPRFVELREYMLTHGQPGPIYASYLDGPGEAPADSLRTEVGFFVQGSHVPAPPFEMAERPSELVATMTVDRPFATVSRHYAVMRRWASNHDYSPAGPITEIFALPAGPDSKAQPTEVQMGIVKVEPPLPPVVKKPEPVVTRPKPQVADLAPFAKDLVESQPASAEAALGMAASEGEDLVDVEELGKPMQERGVEAVASAADGPPARSEHPYYGSARAAHPTPADRGMAKGPVAAPAAVEFTPERVDLPHEPPGAEPVAIERHRDAEADRAEQSFVQPPVPSAAHLSLPPMVPVEKLVQQRKFDRVAAQLLPDDRVMMPQCEVWIGQVVYRLTAITNALERRGAEGENEILVALGTAIEDRYRKVSRGFHTDPLSQPAWRLDQQSDPQAAEKKAIMRALEVMMGRLAVGGLDPASSLDRVVEILQRAQDVLRAE